MTSRSVNSEIFTIFVYEKSSPRLLPARAYTCTRHFTRNGKKSSLFRFVPLDLQPNGLRVELYDRAFLASLSDFIASYTSQNLKVIFV